MTNPEADRRTEYDRWLTSPGLSSLAVRWAMGTLGQWAVNTPLMRIPEHFDLKPDQRWLDIGCGRGALLRFIDSRVGFDRAPVGLDFSAAALQLAREDARDGVGPELAQGSATALPFEDESFHLVTCGYVVKHLTDTELDAMLVEVRRVLVGGGLALIWEFAPTGSAPLDAWNRFVLSPGVRDPQLRPVRTLLAHARAAGYEHVRNAQLRPFLLPPIPRASMLIGKAPEGWRPS
ncbi:MAG: class I SAM-dependent methyltransferase [Chloroflexi bacterium]|nr:MAG: class I SAM-dependent methyltransferase [Chloroflexota bacterium]